MAAWCPGSRTRIFRFKLKKNFSQNSLLVFVQVLEKETRDQEERLNEIRSWRTKPKEHLEVTMPEVNPDYERYKREVDAKATKATTRKNKK